MPAAGTDLSRLIVLILDAFKDDPELKRLIHIFKVAVNTDEHLREKHLPRVVFYSDLGTESTQRALDILYNLFKKHPEIKGSGERPRFNGKVNDLIWVAQGNGDDKIAGAGNNLAYFEQPLMIYYRPDFTGKVENYHLKNSETGKEIID